MSTQSSRLDGWPTRDVIARAVELANPGALRMALYQQTGDTELAAMTVEQRDVRGGSMTIPLLARRDRPRLREKATAYLAGGPVPPAPTPTPAEVAELLAMYGTAPTDADELRLAYEELAFDDRPRAVRWDREPDRSTLDETTVTIIGAGISGLAMAVKLTELGLPYEILERQAAIGGTWQFNDYPGARVDVTNFVYQFKTEKGHAWTREFAGQPEIRDYLVGIADRYRITPHVRLSTTLLSATWDEASATWLLEVRGPDGATEQRRSRVLICATGLFSTPNLPDIAGIEEFGGRIVHTTSWDHDYDLSGKRIALIGTGSSGSQLMPHLAAAGESLVVYQRTPNWVLPVPGWDQETPAELRWLLDHLPYYWNWHCYATFFANLQIQQLQEVDPEWQAGGGFVNERNDRLRAFLTAHVCAAFAGRPDLIARSIPDYPPTARRLVIDNGWYDSLVRPDVELVADPIRAIDATGIVTSDGRRRPFDLIVLGSGFQTWRHLFPIELRGRRGVTPDELWAPDGARAYLGTMLPDVPNFFMFYGPSGQPRAGGFHGWAESFARYVATLLMHMVERDAEAIVVTSDAFERYNRRLDEAVVGKIWGSLGAGSYYLNEHGRPGVNMPWTVHELFRMLTHPDFDDMELIGARASAARRWSEAVRRDASSPRPST